jgi:hypothetical protein
MGGRSGRRGSEGPGVSEGEKGMVNGTLFFTFIESNDIDIFSRTLMISISDFFVCPRDN